MRLNSCWRTILIRFGALLLLPLSLPGHAEGLVFEVASPKFKVTMPGIPQIKMGPHPQHAAHPHLRFWGAEDPYTIAVATPAAAAGMTPLECAGAISRTLAARPGTPPPPQIIKARLNDRTFLAIYAAPLAVGVLLHAHLLSAAGSKHCVEVHATKISISEDDLPEWVSELQNASIDAD